MFSGIVETTGVIIKLGHTEGGLSLSIDVSKLGGELSEGESLSVNGVCLSAVRPSSERCDFDVITETVRCTNFADLQVGQLMNLERSISPVSRFDGHFVQGHVDAVATVDGVVASSQEWVVWLTHDAGITPLVIPKGSIAINGVSLTIAEVDGQRFSVALIPTTLERTNLSQLKAGHRVNIETDILSRTIYHQLKTCFADTGPDRFLNQLQRHGYA